MPSAAVPSDANVLINPNHSACREVETEEAFDRAVDHRLQ